MVKKNKTVFDKEKIGKLINDFKESKKFKIIGLVIIVVIIVITIIGVGIDIAPKNSVTVYVVDQHGKGINGLKLAIYGFEKNYEIKYTNKMTKSRALDLFPGKYSLVFKEIPSGYTCFTVQDEFTMRKDEKVKLEYECLKSE